MSKSLGPSTILFLDCLLSLYWIVHFHTTIFRTAHYQFKIVFDITLWLISHFFWLSFFSSEVTIFNFSDSFPTSFKLFNFSQNFRTAAKLLFFQTALPTTGIPLFLSFVKNFWKLFFSIYWGHPRSNMGSNEVIWYSPRSSEVIENRTFFSKNKK